MALRGIHDAGVAVVTTWLGVAPLVPPEALGPRSVLRISPPPVLGGSRQRSRPVTTGQEESGCRRRSPTRRAGQRRRGTDPCPRLRPGTPEIQPGTPEVQPNGHRLLSEHPEGRSFWLRPTVDHGAPWQPLARVVVPPLGGGSGGPRRRGPTRVHAPAGTRGDRVPARALTAAAGWSPRRPVAPTAVDGVRLVTECGRTRPSGDSAAGDGCSPARSRGPGFGVRGGVPAGSTQRECPAAGCAASPRGAAEGRSR